MTNDGERVSEIPGSPLIVSLNPDGPPDIVGTPGSLEQTIGNSTLADRSAGRFTSTRQLVEAHLNGDQKAPDVWLRSDA